LSATKPRGGLKRIILVDRLSPQNCADNAVTEFAARVRSVAMAIVQRLSPDDVLVVQVDQSEIGVPANFQATLSGNAKTFRDAHTR
jgi:hypothetical protein